MTAILVAAPLAGLPAADAAGEEPVPEAPTDGDGPAWLTPEIAERLQAGEEVPLEEIEGLPAAAGDESVDPYHAPLPYDRIRPGSPLGVPQLSCTANYVFEAGQGKRLAIGTAGHCTHTGEREGVLLLDPKRDVLRILEFGETILREANGIGDDFGLIEIDDEYHHLVSPSIAEIDGPCGWRDARNPLGPGAPDGMQFYGHGIGVGAGGQARHGAILHHDDDEIMYARAPAGSGGDSGSPVRFTNGPNGTLDLAAAGLNTHGLANLGWGTSIAGAFRIIDDHSSANWTLVDSPNCSSLVDGEPDADAPDGTCLAPSEDDVAPILRDLDGPIGLRERPADPLGLDPAAALPGPADGDGCPAPTGAAP